jgi:hypothetical protein
MTLVAAPANSGTLNEAAAQMVACRVTEFFVSVKAGSWRNRPGFDPNSCVPLVRVAGAQPATWRVNLARFGAKWSADTDHDGAPDVPNYGITILPNPRVAPGTPTATWKVVFDGKHRKGGRPIASTLRVRQLTRASDREPRLGETFPAAPLSQSQSDAEMAFSPHPARSIRVPLQPSSSFIALAPPPAPSPPLPDVAGAPRSSPLVMPQRIPSTGQKPTASQPLVVATGSTRGFVGGHQAVWFVALLGSGLAGLLGWSLTSQAQLRGGFRWVAAMGLTRRMNTTPTSKG